MAGVQNVVFIAGEKAVLHQIAQAVGVKVALGYPADVLDVAQPTGSAFDVGLQAVFGVVELVVAGDLLLPLGFEKAFGVPDFVGAGGLQHGVF